MMRPVRTLVAALSLLAAACSPAVSEPDAEREFAALDANGDGFVSLQEAGGAPEVEKRFPLADRNHDGKLDLAEFRDLVAARDRQARR